MALGIGAIATADFDEIDACDTQIRNLGVCTDPDNGQYVIFSGKSGTANGFMKIVKSPSYAIYFYTYNPRVTLTVPANAPVGTVYTIPSFGVSGEQLFWMYCGDGTAIVDIGFKYT